MLPRTGDLLARKYRLGDELGRGAMGIVYEARHETLDQSVAIKILRRSEEGEEEAAVRRFEREARIVAKLDSAHVVKVIDVDRTADGVPYLVMERLQGRDLSAELEARAGVPMPIAESVGWMMQVCEAMRVAHDAGVVHRDLKLSNVFLTRDATVKVLDFGVAVFRRGDPERSLTTSVAGTPRYMAPEQLLGEPPDPSSDIWAIGVMLYRVLGGRFPYDTPTMAAQMLAMMEGCPPLDEIAPRVPPELAQVVARALGRTLEERWPSASALASALAPFRPELTGDASRRAESAAGPTRAAGGVSEPPPRDTLEPLDAVDTFEPTGTPAPSHLSGRRRSRRPVVLLAGACVLVAAGAYGILREVRGPGSELRAPAATSTDAAATTGGAANAADAAASSAGSAAVAGSSAVPAGSAPGGEGSIATLPATAMAPPRPSTARDGARPAATASAKVSAPAPPRPSHSLPAAGVPTTDDGFPPHL